MIWSMSYHFKNSELNFNDQNICCSILKFTVFLLSFWLYSVCHFEVPQSVFFKCARRVGALQSSCSWLKTTVWKIEIEINTGVNNIFRVPSSKTANFTKICQNMPTFQRLLAKATRPKANFYKIYKAAYGPNHQVFQYLWSCQAHIAYHGHYTTPPDMG